MVLAELFGYEDVFALLEVQDHQFFGQIDFFEYSTAVPHSFEAPHAHDQVQFILDFLLGPLFKFESQLMAVVLLLEKIGFFVQISEYIKTRVDLQQILDLTFFYAVFSHIQCLILNFAIFYYLYRNDVLRSAQSLAYIRLCVISALLFSQHDYFRHDFLLTTNYGFEDLFAVAACWTNMP